MKNKKLTVVSILKQNNRAKLGLTASLLLGISPMVYAKVRPFTPFQPAHQEAHTVKGIRGEATITAQQTITLPAELDGFQFQNGKVAEDIEFYKTPRCYLHFKKDQVTPREISSGRNLKVSKIDNMYQHGSVHVTFWFDSDQNISDLSCITNYNHTLTSQELKETLGNNFQVSISKSIEESALINTAPQKNAPVLSEDSSNYNTYSKRVILSDS
jgi:hypothetical protein